MKKKAKGEALMLKGRSHELVAYREIENQEPVHHIIHS
jgi:hypothetical protein